MAIGASSVEVLYGTERLRLRWVSARYVAGVTHSRHTHLQQLRIAAPMRVVAVGAILHYRRMLPQEWSTPFRMATQTVFIDRALNQLTRIRAAVGVMATGARYLAFAIRHV